MCYVCARKTLDSLKNDPRFPENDAEKRTAAKLEALGNRDTYVDTLNALACIFAASDSAYGSLLQVVQNMRRQMGPLAGYVEVENNDFDEVDRVENRPKPNEATDVSKSIDKDGPLLSPGSKRTDN
jgi:crotonobetainyl-CoA:carnitine CoA-transferase CaiB-like acyl-CoA transferase